MNTVISSSKKICRILFLFAILFGAAQCFAKAKADPKLEKMQVGLETDFALSSLPPQLRPGATVYLLDPAKPDQHNVLTMHMPHYMFYAPYLTNGDIGNIPDGQADGPFLVHPEAMFLGERKAPYGYIIVPAGQKEAAKIVADNKVLLKRLADYRPYLK
jgi:hypothetical protein